MRVVKTLFLRKVESIRSAKLQKRPCQSEDKPYSSTNGLSSDACVDKMGSQIDPDKPASEADAL